MIKRILSMVIVFTIILSGMPLENIIVHAASVDTPTVLAIELEINTVGDTMSTQYVIRAINVKPEAEIIMNKIYRFTPDMYTEESGAYVIKKNVENEGFLIWDYDESSRNYSVEIINPDSNGNPADDKHEKTIAIEPLPAIESVPQKKVYIGDSLLIKTTGVKTKPGITQVDSVVIGGLGYNSKYEQDTDSLDIIRAKLLDGTLPNPAGGFYTKTDAVFVITKNDVSEYDGNVFIPIVHDPHREGISDVKIIKNVRSVSTDHADDNTLKIMGIIKSAVKVVKRVDFINVSKMTIIPNRGPKEGGNRIKIYDNRDDGNPSSLSEDMTIYMGPSEDNKKLADLELIIEEGGVGVADKIIGIAGVVPPSPSGEQGIFDLTLVDNTGNNEQVLQNAYTYEESVNLLNLIMVQPNKGKPGTVAEIAGKNIFDLNAPYLKPRTGDKIVIDSITKNAGGNLEVIYEAKYSKGTGVGATFRNVRVVREIKTIIGRLCDVKYSDATKDEDISSESLNKYKVYVPTTSEYGKVSVTTNITTKVYIDDGSSEDGNQIDYLEEEAELPNAFEILPANVIPTIDSIEPSSGDIDKKIYITIKGSNFQVLTKDVSGTLVSDLPTVLVGDKTVTVTAVYDDDYNLINGVGRQLGTKINGYIIDGSSPASLVGPVRIKVTNPDHGEFTRYEMFDYKKHTRTDSELPKITSVTPDIGPLTGGNIITIYGTNFDYESEDPNVQVTIGGQACEIISANSIEIKVKVPRGFSIGEKPIQVITDDGAIATIETDSTSMNGYTYIKVLSEPEIVKVAPNFGGKGTVVYIFGKDKGPDKPTFFDDRNLIEERDDNKITPAEYATLVQNIRVDELIGTRVFLNNIDINEIGVEGDPDGSNYEKTAGVIKDTSATTDPDGKIFDKPNRVEFINRNLIKVTIPDGFYPGLKDLKIQNPDSSFYIVKGGFNYKKPPISANVTITNITPRLGSNTGGDYITIEGTDFKDGAEVYFGGYKAPVVDVINDTKMTVKTPAYPLENPDIMPYKITDVVVVNFDGSSYAEIGKALPDDKWTGFKFIAPTTQPEIYSVEPNEGSTLGGNRVNINGLDFRAVKIPGEDTILPKVYFGGVEAKVTGFNYNKLEVTVPYFGREGSVDVTVKNPDAEFGVVTKPNAYTYKASSPNIISVFPEKANKNGGEMITVRGEEILEADFTDIIQKVPATSTFIPEIDVLAIFKGETEDSSILSGYATLDLGDIEVDYNHNRSDIVEGITVTDNVVVRYNGKVIGHYNMSMNTRRLFILDWKALGAENTAEEGIIVELTGTAMLASRRVAPIATISKEAGSDEVEVTIKTPPAATVGNKELTIENKDRGSASIDFEYVNPLSKPVIEIISPRREVKDSYGILKKYYVEGSIKGGLYITIEGYDFKKNAEVFIDGVPAEIISRLDMDIQDSQGRDKTRIIAKIPKGEDIKIDKELKITVVNVDGSFVDSDDVTRLVPTDITTPVPYYYIYRIPESNPIIDSVVPKQTSQYGGNRLKVVGNDFRTGAAVLINGTSCEVESVNNEEIIFITPSNMEFLGPIDVQVVNNDYGTITSQNALNVISFPVISAVTDEAGNTVDRVSIEGGEKIVISGRNIFAGAQVYFGGKRVEISPSENIEARGLYKNDKFYKLEEAVQGQGTKALSSNTLLVTIPEVYKEGTYDITIINNDLGMSENSKQLNYRVPIPSDPIGLKAEIVNDKYIRIYDYSSKNAMYYEVYTYVGDDEPSIDEFEYLTTTTKTSYKITKFKDFGSNDDIYIKIRAVNKYGPSEWSNTAVIDEDDLDDIDQIGEEDVDGDLVSNYQEQINGVDANITLGIKKLKSGYMYYIDLTAEKYRYIKKSIVNIPIKIIENENNQIIVDTGRGRLQLSPSNFRVPTMQGLTKNEKETAYGNVILDATQNRFTEVAAKAVPRTKGLISDIHKIETNVDLGRTSISMGIRGSMNLEIKYDPQRAKSYKESSLQIYKFDLTTSKWIPLAGGVNKDRSLVYSRIYGPGYYAIIGNR